MAIYSWFTQKKWWFSIAMLVYQRVTPVSLVNIGDLYPLRKKKCRLAVKIGNTYHPYESCHGDDSLDLVLTRLLTVSMTSTHPLMILLELPSGTNRNQLPMDIVGSKYPAW